MDIIPASSVFFRPSGSTAGEPLSVEQFCDRANQHDRIALVTDRQRDDWLIALLQDRFPGRRVLRLPPEGLSAIQEPEPIVSPSTPKDVCEQLIDALRQEQRRAQERIVAAKEQNAAPDPFDRDVAGWLANGLVDLLTDPITSASFMRGIIARLAAGESSARFTETDFQRPDGIRFMEASRPAQSMLTKLTLASTTQYRAAAGRLMNQLLDARPAADTPPPSPLLLLIDAVDSLGTAADEFVVWEVVEPVAVVPPIEDVIRPISPVREEALCAQLFVEKGLLPADEIPHQVEDDDAWQTLRIKLAAAWRNWFNRQLANFDAEEFLSYEDVESLYPIVADIQDSWETNSDVDVALPKSADDFEAAERVLAGLRQLREDWHIYFRSQLDDGMAFDAAVAAGGALLDMLTKDVRWWLRKENRDWKKYRIVRID